MLHKTLDEALAEFTQLHEFQSIDQGVRKVVADQAAWLKMEQVSLLRLNWQGQEVTHALHCGHNLGTPDVRSVKIDKAIQSALESHNFDRQTIDAVVNLTIRTGETPPSRWSTNGMLTFSVSQTGSPEDYLIRLLRVFEQCHASNLAGVFHWKVHNAFHNQPPGPDTETLHKKVSTLLLDEVMELEKLGILSDFSLWVEASHPDEEVVLKIELQTPADCAGYWEAHEQRMKVIRDNFETGLMQHM